MTTLSRKIKRAHARRTGADWPARQQPFQVLGDGGYNTLTPTNGWKRFSARRLRAQARLREMAETIAARAMR